MIPWNRFLAFLKRLKNRTPFFVSSRAEPTNNKIVVPICQASKTGEIDSLKSIPRLLKCLQIRALVCTLHYSNSLPVLRCYGSFLLIFLLRARGLQCSSFYISFSNYFMLFAGVREKYKDCGRSLSRRKLEGGCVSVT